MTKKKNKLIGKITNHNKKNGERKYVKSKQRLKTGKPLYRSSLIKEKIM